MYSRKFVFITASLLAATFPCWGQGRKPAVPSEPLTAVVDGKIRTGLRLVRFEETPFVSLGDVQRLFGGRQTWKRVSRKVLFQLGGKKAEFSLDSSSATVLGKGLELEGAARAWGDTVYVPVSFLSAQEFEEMTQCDVNWEADGHVLSVEPMPSVSSPRFYSYVDKSRVVVELGPRVNYRVMSDRPGRFIVRLFGGRARGSERLEVKDGLVESVNLTARPHSSELNLRLAQTADAPKVRLLESPRRLEISVFAKPDPSTALPSEGTGIVVPTLPPPPGEMLGQEQEDDATIPLEESSPVASLSPIKTIVLDPGHGGKDVGAVGAHGTLEKNINLEIARDFARILKREKRFRVIMTRNDDTFIPLEERTEIANKHKADLFVSIHCNAALTRHSNGFEVYFLSENATDEAAAAVARRENAVVELEGMTDKAKLKVSELLWSLARTETLNESSEVAALMSRQVDKRVKIPNRGVKQAGFYVLKGANMPAVLVESGFITHSKEEGLLRSSRFQKRLVDALYSGVLDYEKRKIQVQISKGLPSGS